jgi:serine/arginine repetitive matrix protein 2
MSYNGIGLSTARGSGTNGYIQKSLSHIKHKPIKHKDAIHYSSAPAAKIKTANQDILMHERLRVVEIKCLEMEDLLVDQGLEEEDVEEQVDALRQSLLQRLDDTIANENLLKVLGFY